MAKLLTRADILSRDGYERARDDCRRRVIELKRPRRVLLGSNCSMHFENRQIMHYQIHEMLRAEGTFGVPEAVDDELHAYNPLITQPDRLSATFMFEYATERERQTELPRLAGIDRHVWFELAGSPRIAGQFDAGPLDDHKIASVQFVNFPLTAPQRQAIRTAGTALRVTIDHPHYSAQAVLGEETRQALAADLAD